MDNCIVVKKLNRKYKGFEIKDVDFSAPKNSITGFLGKNGAGKTTIIKMLLGLVKPKSGEIYILGKKLGFPDSYFINNEIGIVLDSCFFYENLTVVELKKIYAAQYKKWDDLQYEKLISNLSIPKDKKIEQFSKGMKAKLSLALALSHNPQILIMDEPTGGLDPQIRKQFIEMLRGWVVEDNRSVFFSSHIISDIESIADNIIIIDNGQIVLNETMNRIRESFAIVSGKECELNNENIRKLKNINISNGEFIAITENLNEGKKLFPKCSLKPPGLEELMLNVIREETNESTNKFNY